MTKYEVRKLWLARWRPIDVRYYSRLSPLGMRLWFFGKHWPRLGYYERQQIFQRLATGGHGSHTRTGKFFPVPW